MKNLENLGLRVLGSRGKYGGIASGVYAVTREEVSLIATTAAGLIYVVGDYIKSLADDKRRQSEKGE